MRRFLSVLLWSLLAGSQGARGHDSPSHRIEALTLRMEVEGPRADSLTDRGFEYNALGDWSSAVADFEAALKLSPHSWAALSGCAEACLQLGRWEQMSSLAREGISRRGSPAMQAPFYALLAQSLMKQQKWEQALEAWNGALKSPNPEIDWYLGLSVTLDHLKEYGLQVKALAEARKRNPSVVLYRTWLLALVNAGQFELALTEVNRELEDARWKSSWFLLRARIYQGLKNKDAQVHDAKAALEEILLRLNPQRPDPQLVMERNQALTLLGNRY